MSRALVLVALAACSTSASVAQRGVAPRPRVPTWDGQPLTTPREMALYADGGTTAPAANLARVQAGAELRLQRGPSWDTGVGIHVAPGLFMERADGFDDIEPPIGPAIGISGTLRKSFGAGPFRLGLLASAQGWRVPVRDRIGENAGIVRPAGVLALVPSVRTGALTVYAALSAQAAIGVPDTHESDDEMQVSVGPGVSAALGLRAELAPGLWLAPQVTVGANDEDATLGGSLALGFGFR